MDQTPPPPPMPARDPRGHKGSFGAVAVVGGCALVSAGQRAGADEPPPPRMLGGACLAARAALRAGAGLARLVLPDRLAEHALTILPSATALPIPTDHDGDLIPHAAAAVLDAARTDAAALAVGPALGQSPGADAVVLRAIAQDSRPLVLDADGLNALARLPEPQRDFRAPAVLTPHPGEYKRLAAALGIDADPTDPSAAPDAARRLAERLGCVVVLKSAVTVVATTEHAWSHDEPNPALATAGTGDVLAGALASLAAQFYKPHIPMGSFTVPSEKRGGVSLFDIARLGVVLHGRAGRLWCERRGGASSGLLAEELADLLPEARAALEPRA